ncbi:hypothetical protein PsW64_01518 [Pseudovibrio sp. W64]|uniref:type VI secretion system-associated protein TagO n=1 Tax=Pseudovibrio sp. W64 TaxID=1735583 RepID=UPI0007B245AC|nr:type VI secretion system-associated protein TagO [Pseudovibrio sp. W64]KZK86265.1 hypothetical protein PsW64_01518 [Pseudovibrio sp. W64]
MRTSRFAHPIFATALAGLIAAPTSISLSSASYAETITLEKQVVEKCTLTIGRVNRLSCFDQLLKTPLEVLSAGEPNPEFVENVNAPAGRLERQAKAMERTRSSGDLTWQFRFGAVGHPAIFRWDEIQEETIPAQPLEQRDGAIPEKAQALQTEQGQQPVIQPGETNVYLSMKAVQSVDAGIEEKPAILLLSCVEDITTVALVLNEPHVKRRVPIRVMLRDQRIDNDVWQSAESKRILISPRGLTSIAHINRWANVDRVQLDVVSDDGSRAYLFDLANLQDMLPPLRKACHW